MFARQRIVSGPWLSAGNTSLRSGAEGTVLGEALGLVGYGSSAGYVRASVPVAARKPSRCDNTRAAVLDLAR
jgi:hypothetical protein